MMIKGSNILVTGGAGFVGSHLVDRLLHMGSRVVAYDNFSPFYTGKESNIAHHMDDKNFTLLREDILDLDKLTSAMKDIDFVIHEAAQPGVRYCIDHPEEAHRVNVTGTLNVLMAAKSSSVKHVVCASSSSVYGKPEYLPFDEKHPTNPNSPYAASKLAAEKYCLVYNEIYGVKTSVLRYFSVYGPRQRPDQVIRGFVHKIYHNQPPIIFGDGSQTRDFTFISDIVNGTISAVEHDEAAGKILNVGSGNRIAIKDLVELLIKFMNKEGIIEPVYGERYAGDFPHTWADVSTAKKVLGYRPKVTLDDGIKELIRWYKTETHGTERRLIE